MRSKHIIYEKIRDVQKRLHYEQMTNQIQMKKISLDSSRQQLSIQKLLRDNRDYWTFQTLLSLSDSMKIQEAVPIFEKTYYQYCPSERSTDRNLSLEAVMEDFDRKSPRMQQIISLSTVPALCDFFITQCGVERYEKYMTSLMDSIKEKQGSAVSEMKKYICLLSTAFISPSFLDFATKVFVPLFDMFVYGNADIKDTTIIENEFKRRVAENGHLFPEFIYNTLISFPTLTETSKGFPASWTDVLKISFLEPAFKNPERYGFATCYISDEGRSIIQSLKSSICSESIIYNILGINVKEAQTSIRRIFTKDNLRPEFFPQPFLLLSSFDFEVIDPSVKAGNDVLFSINSFESEHIKAFGVIGDEPSYISDNIGDVKFRDLLKMAPLLQEKTVDDKEYLKELQTSLLYSGDPHSLARRCFYFDTFVNGLSQRNITDSLEGMNRIHRNESSMMTMNKKCTMIRDILQSSIIKNLSIVVKCLVAKYSDFALSDFSKYESLMSDIPFNLIDEWKKKRQSLPSLVSSYNNHIMARGCPFYQFVESTPELVEYGNWIEAQIRDDVSSFERSKTMKMIQTERFIELKREFAKILAYNYDPFQKFEMLTSLSLSIMSLTTDQIHQMAGADEFTEIYHWFACSSYKPHLAQNVAYIERYGMDIPIINTCISSLLHFYKEPFELRQLQQKRNVGIMVGYSEDAVNYLSRMTNVDRKLIEDARKFVWHYDQCGRNSTVLIDVAVAFYIRKEKEFSKDAIKQFIDDMQLSFFISAKADKDLWLPKNFKSASYQSESDFVTKIQGFIEDFVQDGK